jgi:murein DD-endopeptidase MepM/ murein hydrolase activator NlpD
MGRKFLFAALALIVSPLAAGCMPDTPETHLTWDANTRMTPRPKYQARATTGAKTYVYQDKYATPTPRPNPAVTSRPLPPPSNTYVAANAPAFAWPVSGRVIADFGANTTGGKNDGINIATSPDAPIHASASGTVTYAGNELKDYGNLVLVKHSGGFTTAYAHADRLVVQKGDFVAKGQVIGYSGQTGDVSSPQLHFEIRANTTPVNPRNYLSSTTARN